MTLPEQEVVIEPSYPETVKDILANINTYYKLGAVRNPSGNIQQALISQFIELHIAVSGEGFLNNNTDPKLTKIADTAEARRVALRLATDNLVSIRHNQEAGNKLRLVDICTNVVEISNRMDPSVQSKIFESYSRALIKIQEYWNNFLRGEDLDTGQRQAVQAIVDQLQHLKTQNTQAEKDSLEG